jgi:hypothetical protein
MKALLAGLVASLFALAAVSAYAAAPAAAGMNDYPGQASPANDDDKDKDKDKDGGKKPD